MRLITFTENESGARDLYYNDVESETTRQVERLVGDKEFEKIMAMDIEKIKRIIDQVLESDKLDI